MLRENSLGGLVQTEGVKPLCDERNGPKHKWYIPLKTGMEWMAALVLFVLAAPLMGFLAILNKISSPGPAFYSQVRLGRRGRPYRIYKIRTMVPNCEAKTGAVWAVTNDARVTRLGRLLRDTHLDELPQLWNVLRGEMNLIGPRPERPEIATRIDQAIPRYKQRLMVRPGVTGLAQVQLPPDSDLEGVRRKLAYDLYYVRQVNPLLDMRILMCTAFHFMGLTLNAVGKILVKPEREVVEQHYSDVKIVNADGWRMGAA